MFRPNYGPSSGEKSRSTDSQLIRSWRARSMSRRPLLRLHLGYYDPRTCEEKKREAFIRNRAKVDFLRTEWRQFVKNRCAWLSRHHACVITDPWQNPSAFPSPPACHADPLSWTGMVLCHGIYIPFVGILVEQCNWFSDNTSCSMSRTRPRRLVTGVPSHHTNFLKQNSWLLHAQHSVHFASPEVQEWNDSPRHKKNKKLHELPGQVSGITHTSTLLHCKQLAKPDKFNWMTPRAR
jgi:hypothetical protein